MRGLEKKRERAREEEKHSLDDTVETMRNKTIKKKKHNHVLILYECYIIIISI